MADPLDTLVQELQERVDSDAKAAYGSEVYDRWRNPPHLGGLDQPDGHGCVLGSCGDTMEMFLHIADNAVTEAGFMTDGCGSSTVCGSQAAELATGRPLEHVASMSGDDILEALGGMPEDDRHCAFLAAEAMRRAVDDYIRKSLLKMRETEES